MTNPFRKLSDWFWALVNKADEEHFRHADRFCNICDGRIWPWQRTARLYSLGMTRSHLDCAANYLRSEIEARGIALKKLLMIVLIFFIAGCEEHRASHGCEWVHTGHNTELHCR